MKASKRTTMLQRSEIRHLSRIIVGLAIALIATSSSAGDSKVRGHIKTSEGAPIVDAKIDLADSSSGRKYKLTSKKDGSFYQRGVAPSSYTLTVERDGYTTHIVEAVKVQAGVDREFEIVLRTTEERQTELRAKRIAEGDSYVAGYDAFEKGDYEAALTNADKQIAANPQEPKGYDMKAKALVRLRRYAEAIPLLERELTMSTPAPDVHAVLAGAYFNAGVLASREGKVSEAISYWRGALQNNYDDVNLENLLGRAYLQLQQFEPAIQHLQTYIDKSPGAADAAEVKTLIDAVRKIVDEK